ncbi:MAG: hypothetical protein KBA08_09160 [Firmicutes bacterium]|nr:hypothetical protein [Bacillota bacterium]
MENLPHNHASSSSSFLRLSISAGDIFRSLIKMLSTGGNRLKFFLFHSKEIEKIA